MTRRDADPNSVEVVTAILKAVKKAASKQGIRAPPVAWSINKSAAYLRSGGQQSSTALAQDILADWRDVLEGRKSSGSEPGSASTGAGAVTSLVLAVTFKPLVECFRYELWESVDPPFDSEAAAGVWLELMYRAELKENSTFLDVPKGEDFPRFNLYISDSGQESWHIPIGGILEKLYRLCAALAKASEWWSVDAALRFMLFGWLPSAIRVKASGNGNYTKKITITVHGPVTDDEVVKAYRRGCEIANITPQSLSRVHFRLLYLAHYLMPEASWPERFKRWLEWCREDNTLPNYGASLGDDGSVDKLEGYRNLKREYKRAMDRQSWTGEVPKLMRTDEFERWTKRMIQSVSVTTPPPAPWEQPEFDTSGFDYPHDANIEVLDMLCIEAQKLRPSDITSFWQFLTKE